MPNEVLRVYRETALPGTLTPNSIYYIAPTGQPDYVEIYVVGMTASAVRRVPSASDIQMMIDNSIAGAVGDDNHIADNIAARNAITPKTNGMVVYVVDASGDGTVASGGATYMWRASNSSWVKVSEAESLDFNISWVSLTGKPNAAPADIDNAVSIRHTHANKTQLDKIGEVGGNLTYGGDLPATGWNSAAW